MDISTLCRGCMKEMASWEKENFDTRAVDMFFFCTNIKISDDDTLPKQFCYNCVIQIESSYTFITEAQKVNVTLKNIIPRNTSVIIELDYNAKISEHLNNIKLTSDEIIAGVSVKLTLPDYKISTTIDGFDEQVLFDSIDYGHMDNETINNCEDVQENTELSPKEIEIENSEEHNLESVKEIDNVEETKKNVCPVCRKAFMSNAWFNKHMEKEHTGHKYSCAHCPKIFSKPSQLSYHLTSHSEERKFACAACGKCFKRRKQLTTHARSHGDVRPFACDKCSMRFKIKSILKCHMKVHENDKQYLCSFCGWSFAQAGNLEVHMRIHTGEKPYRCTECGFRAAVASNLRRHQRRHRGAREHTCPHCSKGFYDASGLARHVRTHTGERPYRCPAPQCARTFADSWKRKTHLMRHHTQPLHDIPRMTRDGQALNTINTFDQLPP